MNKNSLSKLVLVSTLAFSLAACSSSTASSSSTTESTADASTAVAGAVNANPFELDTTNLEKPELDLSNADGVLKDILDNGVLTVATSPDFPPNEWVDDAGNVYGHEMMIGKYIADCLGVDFEIETSDFSGTFLAVDTGKANLALSGYGWKKDRAENYELSNGWISDPTSTESKHTLITTAENEGKFNSLEDFVGTHIIAQANSLQEMYVTDEILALDTEGTTEYEEVGTLDQAILALASGKCDAVALANGTAENYVNTSEGQFVLTNVYFDLTPYGNYQGTVALAKKGETSLMEVVNECLAVASENGYINEWYLIAKEQAGMNTDEE